jgi:microcystin-dependent protein
MKLLDVLRRRGRQHESDDDGSRRDFFRTLGGMSAAALGAGLLLPEEAMAAAFARARQFGIEPGTLVDGQGRRKESYGLVAEPFIGTIVPFGFHFAPQGWAMCNGQLISIAQNTALFALLGTTYGGNGQTTFALPDLRGRVAIHRGQGPGLSNYDQGQVGGQESPTLLVTQIPAHNHTVAGQMAVASTAGTTPDPTGNILAAPASSIPQYAAPAAATGTSAAGTITGATSIAGGSQPHSTLQPYLTLNYCIAMEGIFPSQN